MNWNIVVGVMSLLTATIAFYLCVKVNELVNVQKTIALLALHAPLCEDQNAWAQFIRSLAHRNRLAACDQADEEYLMKLLERLGVKIDMSKKRLADALPSE